MSRLHTRLLSWYHGTPLPADEPGAAPVFQAWHEFDEAGERWVAMDTGGGGAASDENGSQAAGRPELRPLVLVTWNVDANSRLPASRISAVVSRVLGLAPAVDVLFLQEVSRAALSTLLTDSRIRRDWVSSDAGVADWGGQSFINVTLLSRARLAHRKGPSGRAAAPGPVWRVEYPSRFGRSALCCDVFVPSLSPGQGPTRLRLVNVHLDSLPIRPSQRPRQIAIAAALLRSAGRGVVAGDFNPVLPEDEALVEGSGLVDVWAELHPGEAGFTWGVDGDEPFPPNRLDKVATIGLRAHDIEVLHPGTVTDLGEEKVISTEGAPSHGGERNISGPVPWSDHSGLLCSLDLVRS